MYMWQQSQVENERRVQIPYLESCGLKLQFNIASGYHKLFDG